MVILREKREVEKDVLSRLPGSGEEETSEIQLNRITGMGFAVDIGTTTVAIRGYAYMEKDVICIGKRSAFNEQTRLGKDVMMRIMHAVSGKQEELKKMVTDQIEAMALEILDGAGIPALEILEKIKTEFVIVGNSAMSHLFLGESVEGLKGAPFQMAYRGNRVVSGAEIGLTVFRRAQIFALSGIASHVGGDALSVLCQTGVSEGNQVLLAIDLGTNAEILLNKRGKIWCCSAAAGPAFEGRGISCGRAADAGVITGVKLASGTGNMILEYIMGKEICGICGSGLVDLLAELRRLELITTDGYLLSREETVGKKNLEKWSEHLTTGENGERAFCIYNGEKRLLLTQTDIRNLQMAKGAIGAAVLMLLKEVCLDMKELDGLFLAGVLGSSIRIENAMRIGLIPQMDREKVFPVGNVALDGAAVLLREKELRREWEKKAEEVCHLELADREEFSALFMKSLRMDSIFS